MLKDERDFRNHLDYVHFNPVNHGYVSCPHKWEYSSFQRSVEQGLYEPHWCCACNGRKVITPVFEVDERGAEFGE
jgi:putative transposase